MSNELKKIYDFFDLLKLEFLIFFKFCFLEFIYDNFNSSQYRLRE